MRGQWDRVHRVAASDRRHHGHHVHQNDLVDCVSFNDLYALVSEEASGSSSWADANALTRCGRNDVPRRALEVYGPGEESGTFDSFGEIVVESVAQGKTGLDPEAREFVKTIRPDYTSSPNDNVILQGIAASDYSIGWVGFAPRRRPRKPVQPSCLTSPRKTGACVSPTEETIASADFPIARFLYTYVNADAAANDPAVIALVDYMMSETGLEGAERWLHRPGGGRPAPGSVPLGESGHGPAWGDRTDSRRRRRSLSRQPPLAQRSSRSSSS